MNNLDDFKRALETKDDKIIHHVNKLLATSCHELSRAQWHMPELSDVLNELRPYAIAAYVINQKRKEMRT